MGATESCERPMAFTTSFSFHSSTKRHQSIFQELRNGILAKLGFSVDQFPNALSERLLCQDDYDCNPVLASKTGLDSSFRWNEHEYNVSNPWEAARNANFQWLLCFLRDGNEVDPEHIVDGSTPLQHAAKEGNVSIVQLFIEWNADVNAKSKNGGTALMMAIMGGYDECAIQLLEAGSDVNATTNDGKTALHLACAGGHLKCVDILLRNQAYLNVTDADRRTALHYACINNSLLIVQRLFQEDHLHRNTRDVFGRTPQDICRLAHYHQLQDIFTNFKSIPRDNAFYYKKNRGKAKTPSRIEEREQQALLTDMDYIEFNC